MSGKDGGGMRVKLGEPDAAESFGLKGEVETSDAREETEVRGFIHSNLLDITIP